MKKQFMKKEWWTLLGVGIAGIIVAVDFTIVNICLPDIQHHLDASLDQLQWLIAGFGIVFSALLVPAGRLADIVGRRLVLYIGIIGFAIVSFMAGAATNIEMLIAARFLQGFFGSVLLPCGISITASAFPKEQQGKAMGIYGGLVGIGLGLGPALGGIITQLLSWRWIFYINIPTVLISLIICMIFVKESKATKKIPIDWAGMILVTVLIGSLTFAITQAPDYGWGSFITLSMFVIAFLSLVGLILVEKKIAEPLLPMGLFLNKGFMTGLGVNTAAIALSWPVIFMAPLYLQNILGYIPFVVGMIILPMTAMNIIAPPIAGYFYDKKGALPVVSVMFAALIISYIGQLMFHISTPMWFIIIAFVFFGLAWGISNGIGTPIALSELEDMDDSGLVSGALLSLTNFFGVLGVAVAGTVLRVREGYQMNHLISEEHIKLTTQQQGFMKAILTDPTQLKTIMVQLHQSLANELMHIFKLAFMSGYDYALSMLLIVTIGIGVVVFELLRKS